MPPLSVTTFGSFARNFATQSLSNFLIPPVPWTEDFDDLLFISTLATRPFWTTLSWTDNIWKLIPLFLASRYVNKSLQDAVPNKVPPGAIRSPPPPPSTLLCYF